MTVIREFRLPPITVVAAGFGLLAALILGLMPGNSGFLLIAATILLILAIMEPLNALLILLVIAPLKALILAEVPWVLSLDIGQVGLGVLLVSLLVSHAIGRMPLKLELSPSHLWLGLFIFASMLSLPSSPSVSSGIGELLKWIEIALLISICLSLTRSGNYGNLVFILSIAALVQALTGIYQFFGGSGAEHLRILDGTHFRAFGTFGQPNPFGGFLGMTLPLTATSSAGYLWQAWTSFRRIERPDAIVNIPRVSAFRNVAIGGYYAVVSALLAAGLVMSWSRGAWMGIVSAGIVSVFFLPKRLGVSIGLVAIIAVFSGVAWAQGLLPASISSRMIGFVDEMTSVSDVRGVYVTDENYAVTERIAHWQVAELIARDHPWTGVGFDNYAAAYPSYALLEWQNPLGHAHNYYLNLAAEIGLLGLGAYLLFWIAMFTLSIQTWMHSDGLIRFWVAGLMGTWTYIAVHSLVDKLYVNNMFFQLGCLLGLLASFERQSGEYIE